ncbi:M10 family metallopeptidase C-terminal domain-containing protein [Roseibium sp. MMSF_3412]|uniref:M10 family metallopeptidase C-terminal domain-containing protein n=1 Tax=Roseibium sp. MMSF_3412 TaxID=3046712 RepID=UPI00273D60FF|nr:M10 family metallopeptidase C-terminal domain-containing protein [Roseibium sp. MMSF_3412]
MFHGNYARQGPDLFIHHDEYGTLTILNYFSQAQLPDLETVEGALLRGDTVARLAGAQAPGQYAQTGAAGAGSPIGNVQSAEGSATALRTDGTSVALSSGDAVFQGDVVQTAGNSSLVIVFLDETLFTLSADARMVLDELVYSPNGSGNSMVMNLVQGSFVFVTGQVAPSGDMRIETPTATMGIRGTTPIVDISTLDGATRFALALDPGGQLGFYQLFDKVSGQLIGTVNTTDSTFLVTAPGTVPIITPRTQSEFAAAESQLQQAYSAYGAAGLGQQNPNDAGTDGTQAPGGPGSTDTGATELNGGPVPELSNPELSPLGDGSNDPSNEGPAGIGDRDRSGPALRDPPPPSNRPQQPFDDSSVPPAEDTSLALILPPNLTTEEDQPFVFSGLTVEIPGDGVGTVTIEARSTVTLAQVSGLTFLEGDGINDETVSFSGLESDINAALSTITYTPTPNSETGGLSLSVLVNEQSVMADLPIVIQPVEDAPIVFDIALTVPANGSISAPFLGYDPDEGDTIALFSPSQPSLGLLDVSGDGTFTFNPNGAFDTLTAGATQEIAFQYSAVDSTGLVSEIPATVTITVAGVNDAPIAENFNIVSNATENSGFEGGYSGWQQISGPQEGPNGELIVSDYTFSFDIDQSGTLIPGDSSVADIRFSGLLDSFRDGPDIGTAFGPSLQSNPFFASAGDLVELQYRVFAGQSLSDDDAAVVTAELINQNTGEIQPLFSEMLPFGATGEPQSLSGPITVSGDYALRFNVGSFDETDGGVIGARLAIGTAGIVGSQLLAGGTAVYDAERFLDNTSDPDGDAVILQSVSESSLFDAGVSIVGGKVIYDTGNAFGFLADGQKVTDSFQYTVTDGNGGFATATASIIVTGTGTGPEGVGLNFTPVEDQSPTPQLQAIQSSLAGTAVPFGETLSSNAVTYAFPSAGQAESGLSAYTPAQQIAAVAALTLWADLSGLTVAPAEAGAPATIRFLHSSETPYAATFATQTGSTIVTNPDAIGQDGFGPGTFGFQALMHEVGHALGLDHAPEPVSHLQSIMSPVTADRVGAHWWNEQGNWIYAQTPMLEDIAAIQLAYGTDPQTRAGDSTYGFNGTETGSIYDFSRKENPVLTIYDADGTDVLDFSGWDAPAIIDLNPGALSSANGMTGNIGIAYGTVIEKAIGGAGDDLLIGSDLADELDGGAGLDTLYGGDGADTFVLSHDDFADVIADFESGTDRLDLSALLEAYFNSGAAGDYVNVEQDGADTIVSVDRDGPGSGSDFRDVAVLQSVDAGGIIDFVFSNDGAQTPDTLVS